MLVYEDKRFNHEFPEKYPWAEIDSVKLCYIGVNIATMIDRQCKNLINDRIDISGLRAALLVIANYAEV